MRNDSWRRSLWPSDRSGIAPGPDISQSQLDAARSQAAQTLAHRALMEHAIAALAGVSASTLLIKPQIVDLSLPQIPSGIPATLLERRPDIAARAAAHDGGQRQTSV